MTCATTAREARPIRPPRRDEALRRADRFANVLCSVLGLGDGDRLFIVSNRVPDVEMAKTGARIAGLEARVLRPDIDIDELQARLEAGRANAVLTTRELFEDKVEDCVPAISTLHHVLIAGEPLERLMRGVPDEFGVDRD